MEMLDINGDTHRWIDPEFMAELIRRSDEVHAHPERLLNLQDVLVELRQRLKERRAQ